MPLHRFDIFSSYAPHFYKFRSLDGLGKTFFAEAKDVSGCFFELFLLIATDIRLHALGEAIHENCAVCWPEDNDRSISTRFSSAGPRDALLDNATSEVRVNLSFRRTHDRVYQSRVLDRLLAGEPLKPFRFKDPRATHSRIRQALYSTQYYISSAPFDC
jgi:hypothetical protein